AYAMLFIFFFSSRRRHTRSKRDWSSDVCSSDLPFELASAKVFVFIFVSTDCPISNRYAPEIRRVEGKFAPAGVRFWLVYPDPDRSEERRVGKEWRWGGCGGAW